MTAAAPPAAPPATAPQRILALDIFRGMTIALMIIVNTPGNGSVAWGPLRHASWHGFTPTDLVFPSFLFAIGTSAWFSLKRFGHQPGGAALAKIWRRTAILFLIGVFMWHVPGFVASLVTLTPGAFLTDLVVRIRILGVLQRLALCYGIGATLALYLSRRALVAVGGGILLLVLGADVGLRPGTGSLRSADERRAAARHVGPRAGAPLSRRTGRWRPVRLRPGRHPQHAARDRDLHHRVPDGHVPRPDPRPPAGARRTPADRVPAHRGRIHLERVVRLPHQQEALDQFLHAVCGRVVHARARAGHVGRRRAWQGGAADVLQRLRTEPAAGVHHVGSRGGLACG